MVRTDLAAPDAVPTMVDDAADRLGFRRIRRTARDQRRERRFVPANLTGA
ncbi:hypothetical protein HCA58_11265 [Micromonospora sp. HNM0581]|nr:hypothetical protein [Micromonospora sp. HNM0581]NLU78944.1 hypothetical protein [Micromonospora sp. HNM0581]